MALISTEEVRGFAGRLQTMAAKVEGDLESLRGAVRSTGGGWDDERYEQFSGEMDRICAQLQPFYDDAREYSRRLQEKASLNEATAAHGV